MPVFDISHEEFMLVINEEQNHFRPKESIRLKDDQLRDFECDRLKEHCKRARLRPKYKIY